MDEVQRNRLGVVLASVYGGSELLKLGVDGILDGAPVIFGCPEVSQIAHIMRWDSLEEFWHIDIQGQACEACLSFSLLNKAVMHMKLEGSRAVGKDGVKIKRLKLHVLSESKSDLCVK